MDQRLRLLRERAIALGEFVPDGTDEEAMMRWAAEDGPRDARGLGRYLTRLWWERPDLQERYPGIFLDPEARREFRAWVDHFGAAESGVPHQLLGSQPLEGDAATVVPDPSRGLHEGSPLDVREGTTCVGYFRAVLGVGAAGRRMARLLQASGEETHLRAYDHTTAPLEVPFIESDHGGATAPRLDILVLCVNGSETPHLSRALGNRATAGRYRIGLWGWELETFPAEQQAGFGFVDEVWTYSEFARNAIAQVAPAHIAVHAVPLGTDLAHPKSDESTSVGTPTRRELGLPPTGPLLGFAFDYASSVDRKNPAAVIEAYCRAVPNPTGLDTAPTLVLKTINAASFGEHERALRDRIGTRSDIVLLDRVFDPRHHAAFVSSLSGYVSLHRSEGYGLSLLEAMAFGVPVVATAYSGNLDFMSSLNSWLVPYRLVPTVASGQYPEGMLWAEADVDAAAGAIREVLSGSSEVRARSRQAQRDAADLIDPTRAGKWIRERLCEVRRHKRSSRTVESNC